MVIFNNPDQSSGTQRIGEKTAIHHCEKNTAALKRVNSKIKKILNRIPLNSQKEVVEINRLIEEQERLVKVKIKGNMPIEVETLNGNERHRAYHLRKRFQEALRSRKIRK
ncbi:MAG: hypothetical protein JSW04_04420 [Desulfobacterales bacterium]|nr:MAG: hypothetical protein JSW04_04420 [Desulfobacterales bacterium]